MAKNLLYSTYAAIALLLLAACGGAPQVDPEPEPDPRAKLSVSYDGLELAPTATTLIVTIANTGDSGTTLDWQLSLKDFERDGGATGAWLSTPTSSGSTQADAQDMVTLTREAALANGAYSAVLSITPSVGDTLNLSISTTIDNPEPEALIPAKPLSLDETNSSASFVIQNIGPASSLLGWNISTVDNSRDGQASEAWLDINPDQGATAGGEGTPIFLSVKPDLPEGLYRSIMVVSFDGGSQGFEVLAQVGEGTAPTFSISWDEVEDALPEIPVPTSSNLLLSGLTIFVNRVGGFSGEIDWSYELPLGITDVALEPNCPTPCLYDEVGVSFVITRDIPVGEHTLVFTARDTTGDIESSINIPMTVVGETENASIQGYLSSDNDFDKYSVLQVANASREHLGQQERPPYVAGQVLVQFHEGVIPDGDALQAQSLSREGFVASLAQSLSLEHLEWRSEGPALARVRGADFEGILERLNQDPRVRYAEPNYFVYPLELANDPLFERAWHLPFAGVPVAWDVEASSSKTIAIFDTSFDLDHEDLANVFLPGRDFCASLDNQGACASQDDDPRPDISSDSHGSHVAGIIGAVGDNGRGSTGVLSAGAQIVPIKSFYQGRGLTSDTLANAIRWSVDPSGANPADILNLSLGFAPQDGSSQVLADAIKAAQDAGALVIAAVGNEGGEGVYLPAAYEGVIGVGSINSKLRRSCFSNYGVGVDIMAVGGEAKILDSCDDLPQEVLVSTTPDNAYGYLVGTSQATPIVTGVAALLWQHNSNMTASDIAQLLLDRAYYDSSYMTANEYGAGILRADLALGISGPDSAYTITATGKSSGDSALASVVLGIKGKSEGFELSGLREDDYVVEATSSGAVYGLEVSTSLSLASGQRLEGVEFGLELLP